MKDNNMTFTSIAVLVFVALFTIFGFFVPAECDGIDNVYLYCRLHPFTLGDFLGCVLFYGGAFLLSGVWTKLFNLHENVGSTSWNWLFFVLLAGGVITIWVA